jgi:GNAT superfamily N-acetyltransferase
MTVIGLASVDDADEIGVFQTRCWEQAYRGIVSDSYLDATTWHVRALRWRERIERDERQVWTARTGADLVGVASTAPTAPGWHDLPALELCSIYVDEAAHGSGLASELLDAAIGSRDAHLLVFTSNDRAQRFYAKHGFVPTGDVRTDPDTGVEEQRWVRIAARPLREGNLLAAAAALCPVETR